MYYFKLSYFVSSVSVESRHQIESRARNVIENFEETKILTTFHDRVLERDYFFIGTRHLTIVGPMIRRLNALGIPVDSLDWEPEELASKKV